MGILEIVAEKELGKAILAKHLTFKTALNRLEKFAASADRSKLSDAKKQRISSIVELCFEYERETDKEERKNILRTLEELAKDEPLELPTQDVVAWEKGLIAHDHDYAKIHEKYEKRIREFLKKYFSFRAKMGLTTQEAVAKATGLSRSYVAVIELGEHYPQQKTLQKLAKAFQVDVTDLM